MPANKALGAQEEAKKDLVDILKMYMPGNLNQIPAYMQPNRLHTVQGTAVGKTKRSQRQRLITQSAASARHTRKLQSALSAQNLKERVVLIFLGSQTLAPL